MNQAAGARAHRRVAAAGAVRTAARQTTNGRPSSSSTLPARRRRGPGQRGGSAGGRSAGRAVPARPAGSRPGAGRRIAMQHWSGRAACPGGRARRAARGCARGSRRAPHTATAPARLRRSRRARRALPCYRSHVDPRRATAPAAATGNRREPSARRTLAAEPGRPGTASARAGSRSPMHPIPRAGCRATDAKRRRTGKRGGGDRGGEGAVPRRARDARRVRPTPSCGGGAPRSAAAERRRAQSRTSTPARAPLQATSEKKNATEPTPIPRPTASAATSAGALLPSQRVASSSRRTAATGNRAARSVRTLTAAIPRGARAAAGRCQRRAAPTKPGGRRPRPGTPSATTRASSVSATTSTGARV